VGIVSWNMQRISIVTQHSDVNLFIFCFYTVCVLYTIGVRDEFFVRTNYWVCFANLFAMYYDVIGQGISVV